MSDRIGDHRYAYFAYAAIITISAPRAPPPPPAFIRLPYLSPSLELSFSIGKKNWWCRTTAFFFFFFLFLSRTFQLGFCLLLIGRGESWCFFFPEGTNFVFSSLPIFAHGISTPLLFFYIFIE